MRLDRWRAEVGEVWTLAWPMVVLGLVRASYLVADTWWVGHLGADALTAVSASAFAWWIAHYLCELPATGVHARTAQVVGAGHPERIGALVADGALLGLIVASLVGVGVWWGAPSYFGWMGLEGEVGRLGRAYLHTLGAGGVCFVAHGLIGAVFRGVGDMRTALVITTLGGVLNAALDPLLIWGVGPIPALGVAGAGWATAISSAVAAALGLGIAWRRGLLTGGTPRRAGELGRLATIGAPISAMGVGFSLVYVALGGIVVPYGEAHMAALGVGHRIESFPFLTAVGFATAATTLVGQRFGAGDAIGAQRAAAVTAAMCGLVMTACSVVGLVAAGPILQAFSEEPEIVVAGIVYLRLQALVWGLMGLEVVYEGAFTGAGRTLPVMWISSALTAARLPLAWVLAGPLEQGVVGVWIAIALSTALKGLALTSWFHGMSWQVGVAPGDEHGA